MKNSLDASDEAGFTLAELMISMLIFLVLSSGVFALIIEMERAAGYQAVAGSAQRFPTWTRQSAAFCAGRERSGEQRPGGHHDSQPIRIARPRGHYRVGRSRQSGQRRSGWRHRRFGRRRHDQVQQRRQVSGTCPRWRPRPDSGPGYLGCEIRLLRLQWKHDVQQCRRAQDRGFRFGFGNDS